MTDRRLNHEGETVRGVAMVAGVPNANGIVYPPEVAKKLAEEMERARFLFARMEEGRFVSVDRADLRSVAGEVSKVEFDPETGRVTVEATILDTPSGQIVKHALQRGREQAEAGLEPSQPLAVSVAAVGTVRDGVVVDAVGPMLSVVEAEDVTPRGDR